MLELCIRTVAPVIALEWDLKGILREIAELIRKVVPFLLTFSTSSTHKRIRALKRVCDATASGYISLKCFENVVPSTWVYLMTTRLRMGPLSSWETLDDTLRNVFSTNTIPFERNDLLPILEILHTESWDDHGTHLRVRVLGCVLKSYSTNPPAVYGSRLHREYYSSCGY